MKIQNKRIHPRLLLTRIHPRLLLTMRVLNHLNEVSAVSNEVYKSLQNQVDSACLEHIRRMVDLPIKTITAPVWEGVMVGDRGISSHSIVGKRIVFYAQPKTN